MVFWPKTHISSYPLILTIYMSYLFWKLCDQGRSWHWKNDVRSWFKAARNFFFTPDSNRTLIWHCLLSTTLMNQTRLWGWWGGGSGLCWRWFGPSQGEIDHDDLIMRQFKFEVYNIKTRFKLVMQSDSNLCVHSIATRRVSSAWQEAQSRRQVSLSWW